MKMDLIAAADCEGSLIIWKLGKNAFINLFVSKICQWTITQGTPVFLHFIENGAKLMVACSTGCILIFSILPPATQSSANNSSSSSLLRYSYRQSRRQHDYQVQLDKTIQIGTSIQSVRVVDSFHVMIATENKLIQLDHSSFTTTDCVEIDSSSPIQHFDVTADGKHAIIIVADEVLYYNLGGGYCDAHLSANSPIQGMCMTTEYLSVFLSQDRHVEKWVIDWEIECNQKKYFPPLSYHILRDRLQ